MMAVVNYLLIGRSSSGGDLMDEEEIRQLDNQAREAFLSGDIAHWNASSPMTLL